MGIPMYREPSSTEATKNDTIKDPCAAARSAIRRQPTIRRGSRHGGSTVRGSTLRPPFHRPTQEDVERWANRANISLRNSDSHTPIPASTGGSSDPRRSVTEDGQRDADALHQNRLRQRFRLPRNSTVPDLTSRPTDRQDYHPFTPRFAPAIAYHRPSPPLSGPNLLVPPLPPIDPSGPNVLGRPLPASESNAPDIYAPPSFFSASPWLHNQPASHTPSLRRVGQRFTNDANSLNYEPIVDGLGDRQRSVDLEDDHANDAWETLLTTITPDVNLPSVDSSFTSASVSGSNNSHNETLRSSATTLESLQNSLHAAVPTVQMALDPYLDTNPCDYPSSTDSDTESDGEITQQSLFRRYRRSMRNFESMRRSHHLHQSAMNNAASVPTISFAFSDSSTDQDLHQMQAILDRLARREDIPDDWWAAAGLSRTINQRGPGDEPTPTRGPDGSVRQR
ncbi:hypothetical protein BJX70DRAFT_292609 [Aspergillus crustosus]